MLKKLISALLVFAVAQVTVAPPRVFAQTFSQTPVQTATSTVEPNPATPPPKTRSDLRKSLAAEVAKSKTGPLTEADLKRLEKEQQDPQSGQQPKKGWSRKKKLLVALAIVLSAGAMWVAIKHRCRDQPDKPCPEIDTTDSCCDY